MEELVKQASQPQKQNVPQQTKTQAKPKEQKTEKPPQQKQLVEKSINTQKNSEKPNAAKVADKSSPLNVPKILEKPVSIAKTENPIVEEKNLPEIVEKNVKSVAKQVQVPPLNAGSDQSPSTKTIRKKRSELATLQQMSKCFILLCLCVSLLCSRSEKNSFLNVSMFGVKLSCDNESLGDR